MSVSEADASAAVLVLRDGGRRGVSSFTWWTTDGTANAGADFARLERRVERFGIGEQNRTLHVPIVGTAGEGPENFVVHVVAGETAEPRHAGRTDRGRHQRRRLSGGWAGDGIRPLPRRIRRVWGTDKRVRRIAGAPVCRRRAQKQ